MPVPLTFNLLLEAAGVDLKTTRLVRHRHDRRFQRLVYQDAVEGNDRFQTYQAGQGSLRVAKQMGGADVLASFVLDPAGDTVFAGLWRVLGVKRGFLPDPYRYPDGKDAPRRGKPTDSIVETDRMDLLADCRGRLVVDWGGGERAWVQYAHRRDKPITELRARVADPPFPGLASFKCPLGEVDGLPRSWLALLGLNRGVYLLVHRDSGAQYVGSAVGPDGFLGRWRSYGDGHGGNKGMKAFGRSADEYDVAILETAGSGATVEDIYTLEARWKEKLGSRATGLNRN